MLLEAEGPHEELQRFVGVRVVQVRDDGGNVKLTGATLRSAG
jgi:hypothetical protein